MYAIEFFFEENFEQYVRGIWKGLHDEKITSNMYEISEIRPVRIAGIPSIRDCLKPNINSLRTTVQTLSLALKNFTSLPKSLVHTSQTVPAREIACYGGIWGDIRLEM